MNDLRSFEIREGLTKNDRYFKGSIHRYPLTDSLEFYGFELKGLQNFTINLKTEKDSAIYICFNLAVKSSLVLNCDNTIVRIPSFTNLLVPFKKSETISFNCESQSTYDFLILKIHRSHLDSQQLSLFTSLQLDNLFKNVSDSVKALMPNLELCEIARTLKNVDKTTCGNKFIAQGYSNILIGLKIREFLSADSCSAKIAHLRSFEIQQLEALTEKIKKSPQQQYSIKELCKQTGLSVSKLQLGFKEMHNCTVAIFIRNVRLEKALDMLRNTDLNISEIVYSVGLTSRSYFCRIFKKRFRCSPKFYQQQLKQNSSMVS